MTEPAITPDLVLQHNLTPDEFATQVRSSIMATPFKGPDPSYEWAKEGGRSLSPRLSAECPLTKQPEIELLESPLVSSHEVQKLFGAIV